MKFRIQYVIPVLVMTLALLSGCEEVLSPNPDDATPAVASIYPADGAVSVTLETSIVVQFSEPMDTSSCEARFFLHEGDLSGIGHMMMHNQPVLDGQFAWNEEHNQMMFTPNSMFTASMDYTIHLQEGMETGDHLQQLHIGGMQGHGRLVEDGVTITFMAGEPSVGRQSELLN